MLCTEQHRPEADLREFMLDLEVDNLPVPGQQLHEQPAQFGNIPLPIPQLVNSTPFAGRRVAAALLIVVAHPLAAQTAMPTGTAVLFENIAVSAQVRVFAERALDIEEKALGNLEKIGRECKYIDVLKPAEAPRKGPGLYYMDTSSAAADSTVSPRFSRFASVACHEKRSLACLRDIFRQRASGTHLVVSGRVDPIWEAPLTITFTEVGQAALVVDQKTIWQNRTRRAVLQAGPAGLALL